MAEQTLNIPQLVVFIIVAVLSVRWYLAKPPAGRTRIAPVPHRDSRINPTHVDQLAQMFPQCDRRQIAWDLQRNGGNVAATTERVLSGRGLDTPPASFNPPLSRSTPPSRTPTPAAKPSQPDLITRYNLASKISSSADSATNTSESKGKAWSSDRDERQANLQRRREEMILAARRKLEQKEKAKA
ncbi:hypothetical protein BU24DRAFT_352336 [Aaosphaeria arxii CBS 175.79]|uniref:Coupling of ubiquitin conjugation to ER degradation protein 1 n=1 Tax=Aaosphaeria arxii CBS 175.79 TaxID=1450172 RepID=A0A6A5XJJ0_9PLEO|nr:uncharacterized protein BU24DRAFT_352336 [Aaosphaeria arxii CBS 175.79]KAF2013046.1 hypothetical protein BU24DRAFT_352336 [Aaosphaeria arxii CBS 175.79]